MIHVAVGVIREADGRILISRRAADAHQGNLWEFPGGKVEPGESVTEALQRELLEELGIGFEHASPLCEVRHDYGDKQVFLDVWVIDAYQGKAEGREGQPLRRLLPSELKAEDFPVANRAIIRCLHLSDCIAINVAQRHTLKSNLQHLGTSHSGLIQLRLPGIGDEQWPALLRELFSDPQMSALRPRLLLNGPPELAQNWQLAGCHLNRHRLAETSSRPVADQLLLGASCHDLAALQKAEAVGADYALLSPVAATTSHPGAQPLGWERFSALSRQVSIPVYALGGMQPEDLAIAHEQGARGIAGISLFSCDRKH